MSDPDPDDPPSSAASPPSRETRSTEASRRLSQLLARPFGAPAPPGETREPYVPRFARSAPPPGPAPAPPDDTASVAPPPAAAAPAPEPDFPWFDRPAQPTAVPEPIPAPEPPATSADAALPLSAAPTAHDPLRDPAPDSDDDLFDRRDPPPRHEPAEPAGEVWPLERRAHRDADEGAGSPGGHDRVPEWAWPSSLDRAPEAAAPAARGELRAAAEPLAVPEPARPAPGAPPPASPPPAARALDPEAARALGNIRRLMLVSNLFMVVAIGAVLAVVG
jgi:hypothetical protein